MEKYPVFHKAKFCSGLGIRKMIGVALGKLNMILGLFSIENIKVLSI